MKREYRPEELEGVKLAKARGCRGCKRVLADDETGHPRLRGLNPRYDIDVACDACRECEKEAERKEEARRAAIETRRRLKHFDQSFANCCVGVGMRSTLDMAFFAGWQSDDEDDVVIAHGPLRFPKWPWARFENPEFRQRVDPRLLGPVEAHDEENSLVVCAPTGRGKSALVCARVIRKRDQLRKRVEAGERLVMPSFAWISGYELAGARKRSPLGEESRLVRHAIDVELLILDDVGCEPPGEETFVVLDARYREQRPVILTSPLEPRVLIGHLGGGGYRRILEHGQLVEAFGEAPKAKATVRVVR